MDPDIRLTGFNPTMQANQFHEWNVTPAEARRIQAELAARVSLTDAISPAEIRLVAGVDNAYVKDDGGTTAVAAVVVLRYPELDIVETAVAAVRVTFPYVPGLLSFREGPAVMAACEQISRQPDLLLFDGQGYAHPRRCGLASHLGILLNRPAIGCAKSRLIGEYEEPDRVFGARTPLIAGGEIVGAAVRTRPRRKPLLVSPGHQISVETAVELTLACCRDGGFLPVPTQAAHDLVSQTRRDMVAAAH